MAVVDGGGGGFEERGGAEIGLSVVDSAMFSMEQKGVDVVGVENCPLSRSPPLEAETEVDAAALAGAGEPRKISGGGVEAAAK